MNHQSNTKVEVAAIYNGIKSTPGDRDNLPKKEHQFVVVSTGNVLSFKTIKLFEYAAPKKGQQYMLGFEGDDLYMPVSIDIEGVLFYRETSNRIISIDRNGNKKNHSDNLFTKQMGQAIRTHNLRLKAEGKEPIKPIKRKW